jgi:hypothetical protein
MRTHLIDSSYALHCTLSCIMFHIYLRCSNRVYDAGHSVDTHHSPKQYLVHLMGIHSSQ